MALATAVGPSHADAQPAAQAPPASAPAPLEPEPLAQYDGRVVSEIRFVGLSRVSEQFVRNQLRTTEGRPFIASTVTDDIKRLHRLGRFSRVDTRVALLKDGSVRVVYAFEEAPIVEAVQVIGNNKIGDAELDAAVRQSGMRIGTPFDEFQLGRARRNIEDVYRNKGYYLVEVSVDNEELKDSGVVLFRIREGERVKVMRIDFQNAHSFNRRQLLPNVKTKVASLLRKGPLDNDTLSADIASIAGFYRDHGYLDIRVDREITPSPDGKEAIITFIVDEGPRYTLRSVRVQRAASGEDADEKEPLLFSLEQIAGLMEIKRGDAYAANAVRRSVQAIQSAYRQLGYVDASVQPRELRDVDSPQVDLMLTIHEGRRFRTGEVIIEGNHLTKQNVIRRHVLVRPDQPLDSTSLETTRRRLSQTGIFRNPSAAAPSAGVKVTIQPETPDDPEHRDVLIEIEEQNTGQLNFGAAVSSDAGLIGSISLIQRNFDVTDTPESLGELISGRAFRGAGQQFALTLAPGFQLQTYNISLTEPYLFETDTTFSSSLFFRTRRFSDHDEQRVGGRVSVGRRFGDRWTAAVTVRDEIVSLNDIDADAPVDLFQVQDSNNIIGFGVQATRTTVPPEERRNPSRGARSEMSIEQVLGDFTFDKISVSHQLWIGVNEDFLERKSILSFRLAASYIPQSDEAPLYERFFLGGRSFRGFDFRGVSPRGIRNDNGKLGRDPAGGEWAFFFGTEYLQPIWGNVNGQAIVSLVGFIDTGTVTKDIGFSDYRITVGIGVRMLLPISSAPLAFDFGIPIIKQDGDDTQALSFSVDLPF